MAMAVEPCSFYSFIFFPQHSKNHLHHIIYCPFFPFSRSHLRLRFSSYAARGGSSNSRKRGRIKWDSNAETIRAKDFTLNTQNDDEEEEEYDDEEMASSGILKEVIDSIWIFKVFKSYGWTSPVILLSLLFATGPKAFLMALSLPLGQWAITLAYGKLLGRSESKKKRRAKVRRKTKMTSPPPTVENVKMKEEVGEGRKSRKGIRKDYQSCVVPDGMDSVNDEDASRFGGWDELDGDGMGSMRMSSTVVSGSTSRTTTKGKSKLNMKHSTSDAPLLLRLLISVFPFLSEFFW